MDEKVQSEDTFCYEEYQVVQGELFSHVMEPAFTFQDGRIYVNAACIKKLPDYDYVQILVHPKKRKLAIKPCLEEEKDSVRWCSTTQKRSPRKIVCRVFFDKIFSLMEWDTDCRYRLPGKLMHCGEAWIFLFDLDSPEIYRRTEAKGRESAAVQNADAIAEWKSQFGLSGKEHRKAAKEYVFQESIVFGLEEEVVMGNDV